MAYGDMRDESFESVEQGLLETTPEVSDDVADATCAEADFEAEAPMEAEIEGGESVAEAVEETDETVCEAEFNDEMAELDAEIPENSETAMEQTVEEAPVEEASFEEYEAEMEDAPEDGQEMTDAVEAGETYEDAGMDESSETMETAENADEAESPDMGEPVEADDALTDKASETDEETAEGLETAEKPETDEDEETSEESETGETSETDEDEEASEGSETEETSDTDEDEETPEESETEETSETDEDEETDEESETEETSDTDEAEETDEESETEETSEADEDEETSEGSETEETSEADEDEETDEESETVETSDTDEDEETPEESETEETSETNEDEETDEETETAKESESDEYEEAENDTEKNEAEETDEEVDEDESDEEELNEEEIDEEELDEEELNEEELDEEELNEEELNEEELNEEELDEEELDEEEIDEEEPDEEADEETDEEAIEDAEAKRKEREEAYRAQQEKRAREADRSRENARKAPPESDAAGIAKAAVVAGALDRRCERDDGDDARAHSAEIPASAHGGAIRPCPAEFGNAPILETVDLGETNYGVRGDLAGAETPDAPEKNRAEGERPAAGDQQQDQSAMLASAAGGDPKANAGNAVAENAPQNGSGVVGLNGAAAGSAGDEGNDPSAAQSPSGDSEHGAPPSKTAQNAAGDRSQGDGNLPDGKAIFVDIPHMTAVRFDDAREGASRHIGAYPTEVARAFGELSEVSNATQADASLADAINAAAQSDRNVQAWIQSDLVPDAAPSGGEPPRVRREDVASFREKKGFAWREYPNLKTCALTDRAGKLVQIAALTSMAMDVHELRKKMGADGGRSAAQLWKEHAKIADVGPDGNDGRAEAPELDEKAFREALETYAGKEVEEYSRQKAFEAYELDGMQMRLSDFTSHGMEHTREVCRECETLVGALRDAGVEIAPATERMLQVAGKYHDIGMADGDGMDAARSVVENLRDPRVDLEKAAKYLEIDENAGMRQIMENGGKNQTAAMAYAVARERAENVRNMSPESPGYADALKEHQIALARLQDRVYARMRSEHARRSGEFMLAYGDTQECQQRYGGDLNYRNIACAIMLHSKNNSGCADLTEGLSKNEGREQKPAAQAACERFVAAWNREHPENKASERFSREDVEQIALMASVLRVADNRRDGNTATFTNGERVVVQKHDDSSCGYRVYHGSVGADGAMALGKEVRSNKSREIIGTEACTRFGKVRWEDGALIHEIRLSGVQFASLIEQVGARRIPDYVGEIESGVFRSEEGRLQNVIELQVERCTQTQADQLREKITGDMRKAIGRAADNGKLRQYTQPGRVRVVSVPDQSGGQAGVEEKKA